jgi:hypothetical protein
MAIEEAHLMPTTFMLKVTLVTRQVFVLDGFVLRRFYGILVPEQHDFPVACLLDFKTSTLAGIASTFANCDILAYIALKLSSNIT